MSCILAIVVAGGMTASAVGPASAQSTVSGVLADAADGVPRAPQLAGTNHAGIYDAVFKGDPTGATDVSAALSEFLSGHDGQRIALAPNATYRVRTVPFTAHDLYVDFQGARIMGTQEGVHGILLIQSSVRVVLDGPTVRGTGYAWNEDLQWQHGIWIDGGSDISILRPSSGETTGDGIYVGFQEGKNEPPERVRIEDAQIVRAGRYGIAVAAGQVTIIGGTVDRTGWSGVVLEPSLPRGAESIRGIVVGTDIRRSGELNTNHVGYAVAAAGERVTDVTMQYIILRHITSDVLRVTVRRTDLAALCDSASDSPALADFPWDDQVVFGGNARLVGTRVQPDQDDGTDLRILRTAGCDPASPMPDPSLAVRDTLCWLIALAESRLACEWNVTPRIDREMLSRWGSLMSTLRTHDGPTMWLLHDVQPPGGTVHLVLLGFTPNTSGALALDGVPIPESRFEVGPSGVSMITARLPERAVPGERQLAATGPDGSVILASRTMEISD